MRKLLGLHGSVILRQRRAQWQAADRFSRKLALKNIACD
ncbi:hypothetical protein GGR71_003965 [Xanthomonas sp. F1]